MKKRGFVWMGEYRIHQERIREDGMVRCELCLEYKEAGKFYIKTADDGHQYVARRCGKCETAARKKLSF